MDFNHFQGTITAVGSGIPVDAVWLTTGMEATGNTSNDIHNLVSIATNNGEYELRPHATLTTDGPFSFTGAGEVDIVVQAGGSLFQPFNIVLPETWNIVDETHLGQGVTQLTLSNDGFVDFSGGLHLI
jgi:hypothetical protein